MIICEKNNFRFDKPGDALYLSEEQRTALVETEKSSEIKFIIPPDIKENKDKQIYKIGFLSEFLKILYPSESFSEICKILSNRYHIFIARRQIDRNVSKFREHKKFQ
jgi:hypothetical protein